MGGGATYSLAYLLLVCVESQLIVLVKSLCKNFELELKEAFKFCEGLQVPKYQYEGKIIYPNMAKEFIAYLDMQGFFTNQKCFILNDNIKDKNRLLYLTAILNSKTNFWYFKQIGATLGVSGYEMSKIFVEKLPVVETHKIDSTLLKEIENLASEILQTKADSKNLQSHSLGVEELNQERDDARENNNSKVNHTNAQAEEVEMRNCGFQARNEGVNKTLMTEVESEESAIYHSNATLKTLESHLDSLIYKAYGLNENEINLIESELSTRERAEIIENLYRLWEFFAQNSNAQYQGKIIWAEMTDAPCFVYDTQGFYINQTCYFIPRDDKYLCAILNSKLIYFYMQQIASNLGDGAFRWIKQYIEKLPIPQTTKANQIIVNQIIALVDEILKFKVKDSTFDISKLESEIDSLVYKLYNLTDEEIEIIEV